MAGKDKLNQIQKDMDEALDLLEDLTPEELAALTDDFDPDDSFSAPPDRKREENRTRMYEKRDMVEQLEKIVMKNQKAGKVPERIIPIKPWKNDYVAGKDSNNNKNNTCNHSNNKVRPYERKQQEQQDVVNPGLTEEEEELLEGLSEQDLLEFAALSGTHGMLTQEQAHAFERGDDLDEFDYGLNQPVRGPERRLTSMSDDDADLDGVLLLDCLKEDSEEVFYVRINNVALESTLLRAIFDALKTTKAIKHLSLAGVGMKDEDGLLFNEAFKQNTTLESVNIESNELTNDVMEPLFKLLVTHPTIREFKCAHQKHGLGSRGEEAMAHALDKNERLLKISYPFKVQSARSLADRCQIRNNEILRKKRTNGEDFYNYREEIKKRDAHAQPWIKQLESKNDKMKSDLAEQKGRMKSVPNVNRMRVDARLRAKENAKPTVDDELANKLAAARKSRGRSIR